MTEPLIRNIFQLFSMLLIIAIVYFQIKRMLGNRATYLSILSMIVWLLHIFIFYVFVFLNQLGFYESFTYMGSNTWSSAIRVQGMVTLLCIELDHRHRRSLREE